jgi:hypothetical protein
VSDQEILKFQAAVDHPVVVQVTNPSDNLTKGRLRLGLRQADRPLQAVANRMART